MKNQNTAHVEVSDILPLALTLVVAGLGIAFGLNVMNETKTDLCETGSVFDPTDDRCENSSGGTFGAQQTAALNATKDTIVGVGKFADKMGLISTVIVASIVIGLLVRFLFVR